MNANKLKKILIILEHTYGDKGTALHFETPFQLLVATILSAQCTDERVNKVTAVLFKEFGNPEKLSKASLEEVEKIIKSCGLYRNKAKNIIAASKMIMSEFSGEVPDNMEDLVSLPGVGRKTANVVLSNVFKRDAIAVDTHVFRVANRLGLSKGINPLKTETDLMNKIPKGKWSKAHHWLIYHGRSLCKARKPLCIDCPLAEHCGYFEKESKDR